MEAIKQFSSKSKFQFSVSILASLNTMKTADFYSRNLGF